MSVPLAKRKETKLLVELRAYELLNIVLAVTANNKIFPKRNRWQCAYDIVRYAKGIFRQISFANSIYIDTPADYIRRSDHQELARIYIRYLYDEFDIAIRHQHASHKLVNRVCMKLKDIENLMRGWIKSDFKTAYKKGFVNQCPVQVERIKQLLEREKQVEAMAMGDKRTEGVNMSV